MAPIRFSIFVLSCIFALTFVLNPVLSPADAQDVTNKQKRTIKEAGSWITKAGKAFQQKKFERSSNMFGKAQKSLEGIYEGASAELVELMVPQHERLKTAHKLLIDAGQKLPELKPLPEGMAMNAGGAEISFVKQVAPIIVAKCGNCHVSGNRGQFSAATYEALIASTTISDGMADQSHFIEVIENGDMPKGGLTVEAEELAIIKKWINDGAKFDGDQAGQNLAQLGGAAPPRRNRTPVKIDKPTGKETVSFGLDVAPVLLKNCGQCHITRNPRGNLSMAMYQTFIRGGDSGSPVKPGDSAGSEIIKRLRGTDGAEVMPPAGKLDSEIVDKVAKWIDEGAKFEPADVGLALPAVAAKALANSMTHEELVVARREQSAKIWNLAMTDIEAIVTRTDNFLVMGTANESRLTDVALLAEKTAQDVAKFLKTDAEPFVKGNATIYVLERRYDFSEFGKMVERIEFPSALRAHWKHDTTNAYSAMVVTKDKKAEDVKVPLTQQIAALHVSDLSPSIPRWFADGVGLLAASRLHAKEPGVKNWDAAAMQAASAMKKPDDFMQNRMAEDQAGLVSYLFVKSLRADAGRFRKLMGLIQDGDNFDAAFVKVYGATPTEIFGSYNKNW